MGNELQIYDLICFELIRIKFEYIFIEKFDI